MILGIPNTALILSSVLLSAVPGLTQTRIGGFVEYDNITYLKEGDSRQINGRNQEILQLELQHQVNPNAEIFGSVEIRNDQADPARDRLYLDEAYVNLYFGDFDFRVGKQIYAWGRADAFNPTDNLTAWDYSDVLDIEDEKIAVVSARINYYLDDWILEGILIPSFTPTVLPFEQSSRWWLEMPSIPNPAYGQAGGPTLEPRLSFEAPILPDEGPKNTQYALKLTGLIKGWDFSISWFDGFDDLPALHSTVLVDSTFTVAHITVEPDYHRRQAIGADLATTFGGLGIHGEGAYYLTEDWDGKDPAIDDPYLQYVLGLDCTFQDVLPDKDLFILLEWVQEVQTPDRDTEYQITDLNHIFRESLFGKVDLSLGEFAKLTFKGVANFATEDWWVQPGFDWSLTDGVKLLAGIDLLGGIDDSLFGSYKDNRRLQVRLKYSF